MIKKKEAKAEGFGRVDARFDAVEVKDRLRSLEKIQLEARRA